MMGYEHIRGLSVLRLIQIKMTEGEARQETWRLVLCCAGWILLSLLSNFLLQWTLTITSSMTSPGVADVISLGAGLAQAAFLALCLKVDTSQSASATSLEALVVSGFSLALGAAVNGLWLHASSKPLTSSSTLSYWDPVVAMVLVALTTGEFPTVKSLVSVLAVCLGLSGIPHGVTSLSFSLDRVGVVRLLRGVQVMLACVTVKDLHSDGVDFRLRSPNALLLLVSMATGAAASCGYCFGSAWAGPAFGIVATCLLYAAATCLMMGVVLRRLGVVGVALMGLTGQLLERAVLFAATPPHLPRSPLVLSVVSVGVALLGLALYVKEAFDARGTSCQTVSGNERITRVQFLLFVSAALGVLVYVLQPRVSERDLQNLRRVGLERVMRRLLESARDSVAAGTAS